jgi:predicted ester cyclase
MRKLTARSAGKGYAPGMRRWLAVLPLAALRAGVAVDLPARLRAQERFDYDVFNGQKWEKLGESHAADVVVIWPDGRQTQGLHPHIQDLKALFLPMPDLRVTGQPVRFGSHDWTLVVAELSGSFTREMPLPRGRTAQPTGKPLKLRMAVVSHWKDGKIDRKLLFYDQQAWLRQLGLAN